MKKICFSVAVFALLSATIFAQTPSQTVQTNSSNTFDLTQYGVRILPEQRLIVVMAALEAAGFDAAADSPFHRELRKDLANLDPDLRRRMRDFFTRSNKEFENATLSDQAARYVSLAYALTPAPELLEPQRSPDLPAGLLEVLDFAPLVREFYRKSGIADKLPEYTRKYQAVGDNLRPNIARAVTDVTSYLNTRPQTSYLERVTTTNKNLSAKKNNKTELKKVELREHQRNFYVVPDLLAVPNSVKLRVIGDDYFAVIGAEVQPETSSELRRAYLQYLVDPLVYKNARDIVAQREAVRELLDERRSAGANISPDPFLAIVRSLVIASEVMQTRNRKIEIATLTARRDIDRAKTQPDKIKVSESLKTATAEIEKDAFAALSEGFEGGAILDFYFADSLRGLESAGFDVTSSFADMIMSLDAAKEKERIKSTESARKQAIADLKTRRQLAAKAAAEDSSAAGIRADALVVGLNDVEKMLKTQDFEQAESSLKDLLIKFPGEPRILYVMGRAASLSANGVFDENLRNQRLNKAAAHYLDAIKLSNTDTPLALRSQTHVALGKIYEFYEDVSEENKAGFKDAAMKQFEAAITLGNVPNSAYSEAVAAKARLSKK